MTLTFIRCSDRSYQAFCPQHVHEAADDPSLFWDVVAGTMYCTRCGFRGTLDMLTMPGYLTPPELFAMRLDFAPVPQKEEDA